MGIGRTFLESFMKAALSLEKDPEGFPDIELDHNLLSNPNSRGVFHVIQALRDGVSVEEIERLTRINPWFLDQFDRLVHFEKTLAGRSIPDPQLLLRAKRFGFSDARIAKLSGTTVSQILSTRVANKIRPGFFQVDTCAAEFESSTPYFYSSYWGSGSALPSHQGKRKVVVLGSGPNRIGQGIEFDYGCVRAVMSFRRLGCHVTMINSNPETVSTDYDTSDQLFFEPLTVEHVTEVLRWISPDGVATQWGGQTSLNLARSIQEQGYRIMGSSPKAIDLAEDRALFGAICQELDIAMPRGGMAATELEGKTE